MSAKRRFFRAVVPAALLFFVFSACSFAVEQPEPKREGNGWLEHKDGYPVLHLKGTPREMGYQHGVLMRDRIRSLHDFAFRKGSLEKVKMEGLEVPLDIAFGLLWTFLEKNVPAEYIEELQGLAEGCGLSMRKVINMNIMPEFFHCSGFALMGRATANGELLHGRVLDYGTELGLQEHYVLIVQEPEGKTPFVNVSYAGFIGSVSGMNLKGISVGEMGGRGIGHWDGTPMSFLVRKALENSADLESALRVLKESKRTCEYYYVISDCSGKSAAGVKATWNEFASIGPGQAHPELPTPVEDCVLLSAGDRYGLLVERVRNGFGSIGEQEAIRLMDGPVAMKSNLHNVLFAPAKLVLHVANAAPNGEGAWKQKYHRFDFRELLDRTPPDLPEEEGFAPPG